MGWEFFKAGVSGPLEAGLACKKALTKCEEEARESAAEVLRYFCLSTKDARRYGKRSKRLDAGPGMIFAYPILFIVTTTCKITVGAATTALILGGGLVGGVCDIAAACSSSDAPTNNTPTQRR